MAVLRSPPPSIRLHASLASLVVALAATFGCSSTSVVIKREDGEFAAALARFERTRKAIEQQAPGAAEVPLFMMAEGLYRYRLEFPARSFGVYMAQAAAVAVELPALQAVAGSLDLFQLRLKTTDGAVQLWETLLAWHPRTSLRPLILYRLGWAYRNTSVGGLPRESGDEAFDLLIREHSQSPLAPLALEAKQLAWKSSESATAWSIVPGLGQMYVGEYLNGSVRLLCGLAAAALIVAPTVIGYNRRDDLTWSGDWPLLASAIGGLILLSVNYTLAYEDAIRGVVQFNERAQDQFEQRHPEAP